MVYRTRRVDVDNPGDLGCLRTNTHASSVHGEIADVDRTGCVLSVPESDTESSRGRQMLRFSSSRPGAR
jgi:hypothetical protein